MNCNKHLFEDTTLLSEASKLEMFTARNDSDFGYGVVVNPFYNHGHNMVGHDGGFYGTQTSLNKFTDDNIFITVLSNNGSPSYLLSYGLAAMVFGISVELPYRHQKISRKCTAKPTLLAAGGNRAPGWWTALIPCGARGHQGIIY